MFKNKLLIISVVSIFILIALFSTFYFKPSPSLPSVNDAPVVINPNNSDSDDLDSELNKLDTNFEPKLEIKTVAEDLSNPWDVVTISSQELLFTQRGGGLYYKNMSNDEKTLLIEKPSDLVARGEGGMMSIALANDFESSRELFLCFNSNKNEDDVKVVRYKLRSDNKRLENREDVVTGLPSNFTGRHSGCRLEVDSNNTIWIGTGDAAVGSNPQDPKSLGGKILRVDRNGEAVAGNLGEGFDSRIFSYGHRNTQGIALLDSPNGEIIGYSAEHGPNTDDEVNPIARGNFGWNPVPGYNESVTMTDKTKYPNAIDAVWESGRPTLAVAGLTIINGEEWGNWNGLIIMANLKSKHIRLLRPNGLEKVDDLGEIIKNYGRIRSLHQSEDGVIYFTTDNGGSKDIIGRISPIRP